jgi:ABC-type multidrug transport system permease subunit
MMPMLSLSLYVGSRTEYLWLRGPFAIFIVTMVAFCFR